jgi:hypothetical protein
MTDRREHKRGSVTIRPVLATRVERGLQAMEAKRTLEALNVREDLLGVMCRVSDSIPSPMAGRVAWIPNTCKVYR